MRRFLTGVYANLAQCGQRSDNDATVSWPQADDGGILSLYEDREMANEVSQLETERRAKRIAA